MTGEPGGEESRQSQVGRRLVLVVEYEGTKYAGFQLQDNAPTIQGEIEKALNRLTGEEIRIRGASRTDSGAHAMGQVVDFVTESAYPAKVFEGALNHYLPKDVRVIGANEAYQGFNSRREATSRVYQYRILNRPFPSALMRRHYHWERTPLKIAAMNRAARYLLGSHDFRPLAPGHPADRSAVRTIYSWSVAEGTEFADTIIITCEGNGFMQHQIRRTNAVLVEIGKGRWREDAFKTILGEAEDQAEIIQPSMPIIVAITPGQRSVLDGSEIFSNWI